ncbi:MAG: hypothetical protein JWM16_3248 [Verrucomicrobiales bacterium]|nr:hypothetical protein [Verrucomicrobiales bacterium]
MPDSEILEDQASLYVLGRLRESERREFATRLAQSAELRALVRQLEEGLSVVAMTSPQRQAPREVWTRIEKVVSRESRQKSATPGLWACWWRNGWAAAVGCLVCWLVYAVWIHGNRTQGTAPGRAVSEVTSDPRTTNANPQMAEAKNALPRTTIETDKALQLLQARTQEISALSSQVADLNKRVTDLSQDLTQKKALLSDSSRLKFFQLASPAGGSNGERTTPISTHLQRALFLAMARVLGWSKDASANGGAELPGRQQGPGSSSQTTMTNQTGVDFVDLRSGNNEAANGSTFPSPLIMEQPGTLASALSNAVPGFVSGTNAFLAFDPSVTPSGSSLTFFTTRGSGQYSPLGTAVLGSNPTVVTVPLGATSWEGGNITVILGTSSGSYSIIGQFPVTPPGSP